MKMQIIILSGLLFASLFLAISLTIANPTTNVINNGSILLDILMKKVDTLESRVEQLEHKQLKQYITLVKDNLYPYSRAEWWKSDPTVTVDGNTISMHNGTGSIRSTIYFSTNQMESSFEMINYTFHWIYYYELSIDQIPDDSIQPLVIGFAPENFPTGNDLPGYSAGYLRNSFAITNTGLYLQHLTQHFFIFSNSGVYHRMRQGDTVGAGVMVIQHGFYYITRWVFFTWNGNLWGWPVELPADVPQKLYPAISFWNCAGCKVTANFGNDTNVPFKYKIPPANGLVRQS